MTTIQTQTRIIGGGTIALALFFNLPYVVLASTFDYPGILRQSTETILAAFAAGGKGLILTWEAFALAAILMIPVSLGLGLGAGRVRQMPGLAVAAAMIGVLAGLTQAMGLLRWVMVVPWLAATLDAGPDFALIHAYAGTVIGEHLGMLLTAGFVALMAAVHAAERRRALMGLAVVTAALIALGAFEGVALALGANGALFGMATIAGYLVLTVWMIAAGVDLLRR